MTDGTLKENEYHPAADIAMRYFRKLSFKDRCMWVESFASTALSGNRLAEICSETLRRLMAGEPVSDRYLMGLVMVMQRKDKE